MRYIFITILSIMFLSGCATMLDLSKTVCDAALGGSKAGEVCAEIDKLKSDVPVETPAPAPAEVPSE